MAGLGRRLQMLTVLAHLSILALTACTGTHEHYIEPHQVTNLTVVFLDERSLHDRWKALTGAQPVKVSAQMDGEPSVRTLRGFYDPFTATLYCSKWDYEACGHELHHAVLGPFHPAD